MPEAEMLFSALKKGIPQSSGIALCVERLLGSFTTSKSL